MAHYAISGVWKDTKGTITDYAIHLVTKNLDSTKKGKYRVSKAEKYSKADAIDLVNNHLVQTAVWDYAQELWILKAKVSEVGTFPNNYLRTDQDDTVKDNLDNLLNYWNITIGCN